MSTGSWAISTGTTWAGCSTRPTAATRCSQRVAVEGFFAKVKESAAAPERDDTDFAGVVLKVTEKDTFLAEPYVFGSTRANATSSAMTARRRRSGRGAPRQGVLPPRVGRRGRVPDGQRPEPRSAGVGVRGLPPLGDGRKAEPVGRGRMVPRHGRRQPRPTAAPRNSTTSSHQPPQVRVSDRSACATTRCLASPAAGIET